MVEHWENEVDEALRALCPDVPEMDARAFAAGRARLHAAVGATPMADAGVGSADAVVVALPPDRLRRSPPLRKAAPWLGVAAAVVTVAVGAAVLLPGDSPGGDGGSPANASSPPSLTTTEQTRPDRPVPPTGRPGEPLPAMPAQPLNSAGELAPHASDLEVPPGQVRYLRSTRTQGKNDTGPGGSATDELWIPSDREGEWLIRRTASGAIQGRSDKDFEEQRAAGGRFDKHEPRSQWAVTPQKIAALPRDPAALYELLRAEVNAELPSGTGTTMSSAQQAASTLISLLGDTTGGVPADLRAALLRTIGYLPGVTVTTNATASDGRPAVAIAWAVDDGVFRNELLLDPGTARIVEWRNVAVNEFQGYPAGQAFTSDLRSEAVVAELGQRP